MTALVPTTESALTIVNAGANTGARGALPYITRLAHDTAHTQVNVISVDPVPGRARDLAAAATANGIRAISREEHIEDVIPTVPDGALVVFNVDRPETIAHGLESLAERDLADAGYAFLACPDGRLFGVRFIHARDERAAKLADARLFRGIERFTGRGGRHRIFGERGRPEHLGLEPLIRQWFGEHLNENARKYAAGLQSNHFHLELTPDGQRTLPVFVHDSGNEWADPFTLTSLVLADPPEPVLRGDEFCVAEVHRDGVRLHFARLRRTDGRLSVGGYAGFDPQTLAALEAAERERIEATERERVQREMQTALQRAERQTVTRRAPFFMTD